MSNTSDWSLNPLLIFPAADATPMLGAQPQKFSLSPSLSLSLSLSLSIYIYMKRCNNFIFNQEMCVRNVCNFSSKSIVQYK